MVPNFDFISLRVDKTWDVCQFNSFWLNEVLRRTEHQGNETGIEKESYNLHIKCEKGSLVCNAILLSFIQSNSSDGQKSLPPFFPVRRLSCRQPNNWRYRSNCKGIEIVQSMWHRKLPFINWAACGAAQFIKWVPFFFSQGYFWQVVEGVHRPALLIRGTQREYSLKPLKHSIVKRILVFKRQI